MGYTDTGWDNYDINGVENIQSDINSLENEIYSESIPFEDIYEEYRIDPYDNLWYTKSEFKKYYGRVTEWEHQDPKKVLLREEYYKFTNLYSDIDESKFFFLFKQFNTTFI